MASLKVERVKHQFGWEGKGAENGSSVKKPHAPTAPRTYTATSTVPKMECLPNAEVAKEKKFETVLELRE